MAISLLMWSSPQQSSDVCCAFIINMHVRWGDDHINKEMVVPNLFAKFCPLVFPGFGYAKRYILSVGYKSQTLCEDVRILKLWYSCNGSSFLHAMV